jgi:hypothetical protein
MSKIKFYPFSKETEAFAPAPTPASKQVAEWYKHQPAYGMDEHEALRKGTSGATVKKCMPIFDVMTAGYIIYTPVDIYVDTTNPDKMDYSVPGQVKYMAKDIFSSHSPEQVSHYPVDTSKYHKHVFRIMPFWSVGTEPGYSCLFTHPFHRDPVPFKALSAVVDTDKFISDGHLSLHVEKDFKGIIQKGTPLVQVIPFKRDEYEMELVDVDEASSIINKQRLNIRTFFKHGYKDTMRTKKEYK